VKPEHHGKFNCLRYPIEDCEITIEEHEIRLENPADPTFLMEYQRKYDGN